MEYRHICTCLLLLILTSHGLGAEEQEYKSWEPWSRCSKTCGIGLKQRNRRCANELCVQTEQKGCRIASCPGDDSEAGVWPEWSSCSATCGQGIATRIRQCPSGNCKQKQTKTCYVKACPPGTDDMMYKNWQPWSDCSQTCGLGKKSRVRDCKNADCKETEVSTCRKSHCPGDSELVLGEWQEWGPCSTTCGNGRKERKRFCEVGDCEQSQSSSCRVKRCPGDVDPLAKDEYHEWLEWGPCSVTCGFGTHKRRRKCVEGMCEEVMSKTCFVNCSSDAREESFHEWTRWTECSATCGSGERRRKRDCRGASCVENQSQTCYIKACPGGNGTVDRFHDWEDWSPCSVTCGAGKQERRRRCLVGRCIELAERTCREKNCPGSPESKVYGKWSTWSTCSATCGPGEAKRVRQYLDGSSEQVQLGYCEIKRCVDDDADKYRQWSQWAGCTVTCGTGILTRVRKCKVGSCQETETAACEREDCVPFDPVELYTPWLSWGECSTTCGFGFTTRKRYCNDRSCDQTDKKTCRLRACPTDYTEWEDWGPCSVTCGTGTSTRKRYCIIGKCDESQQTTCDMEKCGPGWEEWQEWRECSSTCGLGFAYRKRRCKERRPSKICPGDNYDYKRCELPSCGTWGPWSDWTECPVTCGMSTVRRIRVCQDGDECSGDDRETKVCSIEDCVKARWSDWSPWSDCSKECGKGETTRTRKCIDGKQWDIGCLGSMSDKKACIVKPCQSAKWSKWAPWSVCPVTCGQGITKRGRICLNEVEGGNGCEGKSEATKLCRKKACVAVKWSPWSPWEECPVTCGQGSITRTRFCMGGLPGDFGCVGNSEQTKGCRPAACPKIKVGAQWEDWTEWSSCSVTCGSGKVTRTRECNGDPTRCLGSGNDVKICVQEDCIASWGLWSAWSGCSASCGIGLSLRVKQCNGAALGGNGCDLGGQETKECLIEACEGDEWETWSAWSECPVTCNSGTQARARICLKGPCPGDSEQIRECNTGACKPEHWSDWTRWSECTASCGLGTRYRTRTCVGGTPGKGSCPGKSKMIVRCRKRMCIVGVWKDWEEFGPCSVTCGKGTKFRIRECEGGIAGQSGCAGPMEDVVECSANRCPFDPSRSCPHIEKPANGEILTPSPSTSIGSIIMFGCNPGYSIKGSTTIECMQDGRWTGPVSSCAAVTCERDLSKVERGHKCGRPCKKASQCRGSLDQCICDGWCGRSCFDPDEECEKLIIPKDGYVLGDRRTYGYSVTYGCNDGYVLSGVMMSRTCQSDGTWTGQPPKCLPYSATGLAGNIGDVFREMSASGRSGGNDVHAGAWPWQALLLVNDNNLVQQTMSEMLGEGSIINNKWIMTAAHILDDGSSEGTGWKEHCIIALGMTKISRSYRLPEHVQFFEPAKALKHPNFDQKNYDYDVALIKLGNHLKVTNGQFGMDKEGTHGEVVFGEHIRPVALPCISACDIVERPTSQNGIYVKPYDESFCSEYGRSLRSAEEGVVLTGYGNTEKNAWEERTSTSPGSLQQALLKLFTTQECIDGVRGIREEYKDARYTGRMLCAGSSSGKKACLGVSGGPLTKRIITSDGDTCWVQLGIISWRWGCGGGAQHSSALPGYYTDVSSVMEWVVNAMDKN